jgi:hypothetical protein
LPAAPAPATRHESGRITTTNDVTATHDGRTGDRPDNPLLCRWPRVSLPSALDVGGGIYSGLVLDLSILIADLFQATIWVFLAMTLYLLLKHVNKNAASVMVVFTASCSQPRSFAWQDGG